MASNSATITIFLLTLTIVNTFCKVDDVLWSSDSKNPTLEAGSSLEYGKYVLKMQHDCNLVLYDNSMPLYKNRPVWATNTVGKARDCYLSMQSDGDLVIRDPYAKRVWASNIVGAVGDYVLVLQNNRNLVIYGNPDDHDAETHNKIMVEEIQKIGTGGIRAIPFVCNIGLRMCDQQDF